MASRDFLKHVVSTSEPVGSALGDQWYNPATNVLSARLAVNGTSVSWVQTYPSATQSSAGGGASAPITISNKTSAYTVVASDAGTIINCTSGTFTVSLTAAATLGSGFNCWILNTGTGAISISSSEAFDGNFNPTILRQGAGYRLVCDGTNFNSIASRTSGAGGATTVQLGSTANASANGAVAIGLSTVASNNNTIAIGNAASASGSQAIAIGVSTSATSVNATAIGLNSGGTSSQAVTGSGAMALGGSYASGVDSFAAAIGTNVATSGARSTGAVALGSFANANTSSGAVAIGNSTAASGTYSMALGFQTTVSGTGAFAFGATTHLYPANATAANSFAFGAAAQAVLTGKLVISGGDLIAVTTYQQGLQAGIQVLRGQTTDATAKILVSDTGLTTAGTLNQVILPNNSAYAFSGTIVARRQAAGGTQSAAWRVEGLIRREASAAATVLVSSAVNTISNVPAWAIALTADVTNGALAVTVTGAAATNIRWVATIDTSEVIYA